MRTNPMLEALETALACGGDARRIRILTRIADLFVANAARYRPDQIGVFDQLMTRLVHAVDAGTRSALAQRLAPVASAPGTVIHMLAFDDDIAVAGPVLVQAQRLGTRALLAAADKSLLHRAAIARRKPLSEAVTDALVKRGDRDVVQALVRNTDARFSDAGFRMLVDGAIGDDALATELGRRRDMPRAHALMLVVRASRQVRARLAGEHPDAARCVGDGLDERPGAAPEERRNTLPGLAAARAELERVNRPIGEADVYHYAREHKLAHTAIALSILCEVPVDLVAKALRDPGAGIVPILARVAGLSLATTKAVLLLRPGAEDDLEPALAGFERLQAATAHRVLGFFRTRMKQPAVRNAAPAAAREEPQTRPEQARLSGAAPTERVASSP